MVDTSSSIINLTNQIIRSNGQKLKVKDDLQHHQSPRSSRVKTFSAYDVPLLQNLLAEPNINKRLSISGSVTISSGRQIKMLWFTVKTISGKEVT